MTAPISLYIHFPYCIQKCPYCDFNSHTLSQRLPEAEYTNQLVNDLMQHQEILRTRRIGSIFFGGGTPSLFSPDSFKRLIGHINKHFTLDQDAEITIESNPGTFEKEKFHGFYQAGINRISIGVQSFDDNKLKRLGRIHGGLEAKQAILGAKDAGFDDINIDLMYGLPNQTRYEAQKDIETALSFNPSHLSWYQLTIEPNTIFHSIRPTLPEDDLIWHTQDKGHQQLLNAGFNHYEVSAYYRTKPSQHNLNYWTFGDYLGIGAGAHSKITLEKEIYRFHKKKQPDSYMKDCSPQGKKQLRNTEKSFEFMLNFLRLNQGFDEKDFTSQTFLTLQDIAKPLALACQKGLLTLQGSQYIKTELGHKFLNNLMELFLQDDQDPLYT